MDGQRTPQRSRQLTPSRPAGPRNADDRNGRGMRSSSSRNGRNGGQGFGDRVREFTGRMPLVKHITGRQRARRIDREWKQWEDAGANNGWGAGEALDNSGPGKLGMADAYARPSGARNGSRGSKSGEGGGRSADGARPKLRDRSFSMKVIAVVALMSVIVGFCCTQSTLTVVDAASAALDAKAQATAIEGILKNGNVTDVNHLTEMQTRLTALNSDLVRLQSAMPGPVAGTSAGRNLDETLTMARHLVQAGHYGLDAALILIPHLKGALSDIGKSAGATPTLSASPSATRTASPTATAAPSPTATTPPANTTVPGGVTMEDVSRAREDIAIAGALAQQALAERQNVDDKQLSSLGLGSIVSMLHKMDAVAPKLPTYLGYADKVMQALPDLLGITKPAHFLLFNIDSDELRSTGGFMGNYAVLTVQNGRLIGGVHLNDIYNLDCPQGYNKCPVNVIPDLYSWMNSDPTHFGVRDSNLSPDFPTAAKLILQLYQKESGKTADGVIMITPAIIKDILKMTGKITIPGFSPSIDETNLQEVIHYYHILNRNTVVNGKSTTKALDSVLGGTLLKRVGTLSAAQQSALMKNILQGIGTKDLQLFFDDTRVESVLNALHMDSTVPMPKGEDSLLVTDVNTGATYFSNDLQEKVVDTITFDSKGNAIHDMTITYHLPIVKHLYTPIYIQAGAQITWYTGISRVIVPDGSTALSNTPTVVQCSISTTCDVIDAPEAGRSVWAVRIFNMQTSPDTELIIHVKWTTPNVLKSVNGNQQYTLLLYKQASSHINYDITIKPPRKSQIVQPLPAPLKAATATSGAAQFTINSLTKDTVLTVTFTGS